MLTIYKVEMDSMLGYWEAVCGIDGREFTAHAAVWVEHGTRELQVLWVGGNCQYWAVKTHWQEIEKAIREAVVARCHQ